MQVRLSRIEWDTEVDGEQQDVELPSELVVDIVPPRDAEPYEIEELALDAASNKTGWCILSSAIEAVS